MWPVCFGAAGSRRRPRAKRSARPSRRTPSTSFPIFLPQSMLRWMPFDRNGCIRVSLKKSLGLRRGSAAAGPRTDGFLNPGPDRSAVAGNRSTSRSIRPQKSRRWLGSPRQSTRAATKTRTHDGLYTSAAINYLLTQHRIWRLDVAVTVSRIAR